ncbi:MAG TPA: hypothetical protein VMW92_01665 [Candidatus Heimdallarchaeota archaeon]|nr:hypothetical protein [Candidatus Heimdallarchaeota archaeon]
MDVYKASEFFLCDLQGRLCLSIFIVLIQNKDSPSHLIQDVRRDRVTKGQKRFKTIHAHKIVKIDDKEEKFSVVGILYA